MCGIAGIINKNKTNADETQIKRMIDLIAHRGPDAEGIFCDGNFGVGHRRLSIVDLSNEGTQPMTSHDSRYVISFNGEIYNYIELKEELKNLGCSFYTETDTEVIIEAYRKWGNECTNKFNGMWAFVIYDKDERTAFFSRDRFGVKPLYILEDDKKIAFASEIKCLLEIFPEERQVDEVAIARYFAGIQEDSDEHTFYKNIKNFLPACNMVYRIDDNSSDYKKYWEINKKELREKYTTKNPYKTFRNLFEDAIKIRLRADVPIGASLSGGLDSSAIVSVVKKKFGMTMNTFSSIYEEEDCNEEEFIRFVNEDSKAIPHYIYPDQSENIIEDLKQMMYYHDGPCEAASPYSGFCVYRGVSKDATVMLDGQGADELFGGYLNTMTERSKDILEKNTFASKMAAMKYIGAFQEAIPNYANCISEEMVFGILGSTSYKKYSKQKKWSNPRNNSLPDNTYTEEFKRLQQQKDWVFPDGVETRLQKTMYIQLFYSMLPRILHDVDRNSMARSLEVRLPFLDYRMVEFAYALDDKYKLKDSWTKYVMRKALKSYLPKKIYSRRNKMGFPAPFDVWLRDDKYKDGLKNYIIKFGERGIINTSQAIELFERHLNGQRLEHLLFKMVSLEMWLEDYIDTEDKKWRLGAA